MMQQVLDLCLEANSAEGPFHGLNQNGVLKRKTLLSKEIKMESAWTMLTIQV